LYRASRGFTWPFVETRHRDRQGRVLPWDGEVMGELEVRGPWVAKSCTGDEDKDRWTHDGWLKTGDIVTIDAKGDVRSCNRARGVVKFGGGGVSNIALVWALLTRAFGEVTAPADARARVLSKVEAVVVAHGKGRLLM
jgi:fatty-acyl-CoA synthase